MNNETKKSAFYDEPQQPPHLSVADDFCDRIAKEFSLDLQNEIVEHIIRTLNRYRAGIIEDAEQTLEFVRQMKADLPDLQYKKGITS